MASAPVWPVSHYRIVARKVSPGRQFTGKNQPRLAAGENFSGSNPIINGLFYGAGDILIKKAISNP